MNKLLTTGTGGEPIYLDDLRWNDDAYRAAMTGIILGLSGSNDCIIQGCDLVSSTISAGYILLSGEILRVDSHIKTNTYFAKVVTYDASGQTQFKDGTTHQVYQKNRATCTSATPGLAYNANKLTFYATGECMKTGTLNSITLNISSGTVVNGTASIATSVLANITSSYPGAIEYHYNIADNTQMVYFDVTLDGYSGVYNHIFKIYDSESNLIKTLNTTITINYKFLVINTGNEWLTVPVNAGIGSLDYCAGDDLRLSDSREQKSIAGITIHKKVIPIGVWNMNTTDSVTLSHGLTDTKILSIIAVIYLDSALGGVNINSIGINSELGGTVEWLSGNIYLLRTLGGVFDSANFQTTPTINGTVTRGYVTIEYIS
jgi:hypothetical protein